MSEKQNNKIRVLVVDDSALMSRQIANILGEDPSIEVVARAKDGMEALELIKQLEPDVVTMDVEMPRMNGITALKHIMVRRATPTVMISALTKEGARTTFDALKYGAIDVIAKPSRREDENLEAQKADIISKVRRAASIRTGRAKYIRVGGMGLKTKVPGPKAATGTRFIGIGSGTGGYYALLRIVPALPDTLQDVIVAVIHVAARYVEPFVSYLDAHSAVRVKTPKDNDVPLKGTCYVCSNQESLVLEKNGDQMVFKLHAGNNDPPAAIDNLFISLAQTVAPSVMGVVMTGSGKDGAEGISEIRKNGGLGVIQDINNCVDPSMPIAVLEKGIVDHIIPDYEIADFILKNDLNSGSDNGN